MARLPLRRVLFGFAAGAAAGWFAGLLRTPATAPLGSSAGRAPSLPQEDFGQAPAERERERGPEPELQSEPELRSEPELQPELQPEPDPYPAGKPARRRKPAPGKGEVAAAAAEELRAGQVEATEKLDDAELPPAPTPATDPKTRRRRTPKRAD